MEKNDDNDYKWPSIKGTVANYLYALKKFQPQPENPNPTIYDLLLNTPVYASVKFDGTNVGIDIQGNMYGRNKNIDSSAKSYLKTPLDGVKAVNAKNILSAISDLTGSNFEPLVENFLVYGELMCNKGLFDYAQKSLPGTFQIFGAIIAPKDEASFTALVDALKNSGLAYMLYRENQDPADDFEDENEGDCTDFKKRIQVPMNDTYRKIIEKLNYPCVPVAEKLGTFEELVNGNFEWMLDGYGEGLIVNIPASGQTKVTKWKIGAEKNSDSQNIAKILPQVQSHEHPLAGRMVALLEKLEQVAGSFKVMGVIPPPPGQQNAKKAPAQPSGGKINLTPEIMEKYEQPIKSAKTKYDHHDEYFKKGMKGLQEYSKEIAKECLSDMKIAAGDEMNQHNLIVEAIVKADFIEFNKKNAGGKKKKN